MTTETTDLQKAQQKSTVTNGVASKNSILNGASGSNSDKWSEQPIPEHLRPRLPTFPLEDGYRLVYDEVTDAHYHIPLTLREVLFPIEDDIGVVKVAQGISHHLLITLIIERLRLHLLGHGWGFLNDVLIQWGVPGVTNSSPDITAIRDVDIPVDRRSAYLVGREGPMPSAVIEVTSRSTRSSDFGLKRTIYAALGVEEYLIIDLWGRQTEPWRLYGYQLGTSPFYDEIAPDVEGGITLQSMGLRFVADQREQVRIFDVATGEELQHPSEFRDLAKSEAARAESEAARADAAEASNSQLLARIQELENQQKAKGR